MQTRYISTAIQAELKYDSKAVQTDETVMVANPRSTLQAEDRQHGINPRSTWPVGPFNNPNGLQTSQPPAADTWRDAPKFYPPLNVASERRYHIPNPLDLQRPTHEAETYYLVTRGQAVGIFIDRNIASELVTGIYNSQCTEWESWESALWAYKAAFELNMLAVTPLPGGYWDTQLPSHVVEDSDNDQSDWEMDDFPIEDDEVWVFVHGVWMKFNV